MIKNFCKVIEIPIANIRNADLNSNTLEPKEFQRIIEDIKANGFCDPIKVRKNGKGYIVTDGHHRLEALRHLQETKIPCIVLPDDSQKAKIRAIHFNTARGRQDRKVLAQIIKQLQAEGLSLAEITNQLIFDEPDLLDALDLLTLPDNLEQYLKDMSEREAAEAPTIYTFVVAGDKKQYVENALDLIGTRGGEGLSLICQKLISQNVSKE